MRVFLMNMGCIASIVLATVGATAIYYKDKTFWDQPDEADKNARLRDKFEANDRKQRLALSINYSEIERAKELCNAPNGATSIINIPQTKESYSSYYNRNVADFLTMVANDVSDKGWSARVKTSNFNGKIIFSWCAVISDFEGLPARPLTGDEIRKVRGQQ